MKFILAFSLQLPLMYVLRLGVQDVFGKTASWIIVPSLIILLILYNIAANFLNIYLKALLRP